MVKAFWTASQLGVHLQLLLRLNIIEYTSMYKALKFNLNQGIIADGDDGSHWVTVDDKGSGSCDGTIFYETGDLGLGYCDRLAVDDGHETRLFCGYADCTGYLEIECTMLSGCHG